MRKITCAYCGAVVIAGTREHVIPRCLYPRSKSASHVQRLTVDACVNCNNGWADDEAHFRNVLLLAGESNEVVREIWKTTAARSFVQPDGEKRLRDLIQQMKPVQLSGAERHMIYPGEDFRVMRVVRKVIRGLCCHHGLRSPVADNQVWADVLKYVVPQEFLDEMPIHHREKDVVEYRYLPLTYGDMESMWLLTFFEKRTFIGIVSKPEVPSADGTAA